jgi:hypothetical protein
MALNIPILSSLDTKGFDKAAREFKNLKTNSEKSAFAIKKATVPAVAAIGALAGAAVMASKAAIEDQAAQVKLAGTLERTTGATDATIAATEAYIDQMSRASAVADDDLRPALSTLLLGTKDLGKAQELLAVGLDLSAATGKDLATTTNALARGYAGNTKGLKSLSPEIAALIKDGGTFSDVLSVLKKNFGGASDEAANTAAGGFKKLQISISETVEGIGQKLLPVIDVLLPFLIKIGRWSQDNTGYILAVGIALGGIAAAVVLTSGAMAVWNAAAVVTTAINTGLASSYFAVQIATGIGIATALVGVAAIATLAVKLKGTIDKASKAQTDAMKRNTSSVRAFEESQRSLIPVTTTVINQTDKQKVAQDKATASNNKAKAAAKALAEQVVKLKDALRDQMATALAEANAVLDTATAKFDAFSQSVADSVKSSFSFGDAQKTAADNIKAVGEASDNVAAAQRAVAKAMAGTDPEALSEAYRDLAEANQKLNDAQSSPKTFLDNLKVQANKVKDFGVLVNRLLAAGLSESALQQVLAAGVDGGTAIAQELLGSAGAILEANALTADVQTIADTVGVNSAKQFYQAGVTAGTNLVAGIQAVIDTYTIRLGTVNTAAGVGGLTSGFTGDVGATMGGNFNPLAGINFGMGTLMADGGVVTRATSIIAGEAGSEAIIPLDRLGDFGGGDTNVTIHVNGGDPNAVVQALRTYMRQNGSIPIRTSNIF